MIKAIRAKSIAVTRSEAKQKGLLAVGAYQVLIAGRENIQEAIFKCTEGLGAEVIYDAVGGPGLEELIWAVLTRSDPATSIDIIRNAWSTPLDPRIEPERKAAGDLTNSRAVIDACRPWHWRDQFPKVSKPSPEERRIAQERFGHLFKS